MRQDIAAYFNDLLGFDSSFTSRVRIKDETTKLQSALRFVAP
jgi:hypothetical protein